MAVDLTPELKAFLETSDHVTAKRFREAYGLHLAAKNDPVAAILTKAALDEAVREFEQQGGTS